MSIFVEQNKLFVVQLFANFFLHHLQSGGAIGAATFNYFIYKTSKTKDRRKEMASCESSDTVKSLCGAISRGDIDAAINFYEPDAKVISESGIIAKGTDAICKLLEKFIKINPNIIVHDEKIIEGDDFIVCCFQWKLVGTSANGSRIHGEGNTIEVLRQQADGSWRIALESPWGGSILV